MTEPERIHEHERPRAPEQQPAPEADPGAPLKQFASDVGNRAFGGAIARTQGAGILPSGEVHPSVQSTLDATRGTGAPLDPGVRERMEPALGDLSDVRVHTGSTAHELNHAVSARAFATGSDVYFAPDQFKPNTADGDRLIAHELAHVVQQRGAPTSGPLTVSNPGDAIETEADAVAERISG
ncbi:MAG TPA: DUF4157 domain-containing protein [Solirubrobacter sp.]|nr:DUF4157 domain-containing protein [Solirubrobacter sp.]